MDLSIKPKKIVNVHHDLHDANRLALRVGHINKHASTVMPEKIREAGGKLGKLSVRIKEAGLDGFPETWNRYEEIDSKIQGTFEEIETALFNVRKWQSEFLAIAKDMYGEEEVKNKIQRIMKNKGK